MASDPTLRTSASRVIFGLWIKVTFMCDSEPNGLFIALPLQVVQNLLVYRLALVAQEHYKPLYYCRKTSSKPSITLVLLNIKNRDLNGTITNFLAFYL
ncbi:hypothetical protein B5D82_16225 [Cognaticolwellia beringensis]|uniref:Uncharacterized protein n=1 Tax=Cognaticolwellia beringensis TaxID=1967665 RepID=A0A222GB94_9GAMM|nr:hypothetical protein B5D82_16225 [Cognaticolwellia beringensis]